MDGCAADVSAPITDPPKLPLTGVQAGGKQEDVKNIVFTLYVCCHINGTKLSSLRTINVIFGGWKRSSSPGGWFELCDSPLTLAVCT